MNPKVIRTSVFSWVLGLCLLISVPLRAQVAGGTLSGTITDPSGAAVPNAQVVIKNSATGITRTVTTNADGFYSAANLLPGNYEIEVSSTGFNTEIKKGIVINVGAQPVFNLILQIGTVANSVEVTTEAPTVQLTSSDIGATVNATTVRELPLNGRSWTDLAALQPGVATIQTQPSFATGADRGNRGFGQQLTISGARPQQNNYRLDGVSLNDYANGAPGSVLGGNLGVDAIQEFSVLTSNYSAEYGKTSGGVVNAITRSGTNAFHGSAYEFLRNSALDARNFFEQDLTQPKAGFRRNQFGGTMGGPIIKNRTFFFADYEGIRQSKGIANTTFVPSQAARNGQLCSTPQTASTPCNPSQLPAGPTTDTNGVDLAVKKYLALFPVPLPQNVVGNGDTGKFTYSAQQVIAENFVTTRIDHKFSDKDSLFGTYLFDRTPYSSPDGMGNVQLNTNSSRQIVAAEETHSFTPSFVNAVRFGFNHEIVHNNESVKALNPAAGDTSLGAFPNRYASFLNIGGLSSNTGGLGGLPTYLYDWNSYQGYDDAFYTKGTHSIKFGVAFEKMMLGVTALSDPNGVWNFTDVKSFLTNNPNKFAGGIASSLTPRNFRQSLFGAYIQDDWRFRSNLTLNLGLRYEMTTVPTETQGKLVNLRNISDPLPVCGVNVTGCSGAGPLYSNPTLRNFEPRIGFAWDPFSNGKMAVRGGAGLFDVLPLPYQVILLETQANPFFQYTSLKVSDFANATSPQGPLTFPFVNPADITGNKSRSAYVQSNSKRNYVAQWNLNAQYQLTSSLAAMVAYVGSRGVHQPYRVDEGDLVIPTLTSAGYLWPKIDALGNLYSSSCNATDPFNGVDPAQCAPPATINPNFGSIRSMFYQGRSYYNALEFQLAKRMSRGFQVQGTFTWAKSIDTSSATVAGDAFGNSISSLNWFDPRLTRGLSDFNVGRTLVINGTWEVPTPKSFSGPAQWLAGGWELGTILTVSDGVPFTPTWGTGSDPANTLSSDDFAYPNRLGGPGCATLTNPGNPNNYIKTRCFTIPSAPDMTFFNNNCNQFPPSAQPNNPPAVQAQFPQCFNLRGNSGRNILIGPGIMDMDFSVFKNNPIRRISENFNIQFRAEMFNILNHPNFAPPGPGDGNTDLFSGAGNSLAGSSAGALVKTTVAERQIQFALKVIF